MSLPVAILAGGRATRLGPVAHATPKVLVSVAGRPFIEHQFRLLAAAGLCDIVLLVGHLGEQVQAVVGDGVRFGVRVRCVPDGPEPLGTGGAVRRALPSLGDRFFVLYGDSYLDCDYRGIEQAFLTSGRQGLMTVFRNDGQWDRSNVRLEEGEIAVYDKTGAAPGLRYIDYGLGAFVAAAFDGRPEGPFDLVHVYQDLLARRQLACAEVTTRFYEIGSPAGLAETDAYLRHKEQPS